MAISDGRIDDAIDRLRRALAVARRTEGRRFELETELKQAKEDAAVTRRELTDAQDALFMLWTEAGEE